MLQKHTMRFCLIAIFCSSLLTANAQNGNTLFQSLPASATGIDFSNILTENDTLNILNQANIYNGGGVGVGDFNNDGLPDLYFAGNMVSNKLYINKGSLKFADYTEVAGVNGSGRWCTGVSVVDINADGWLDIYVAASFSKDPKVRTNLLYINQGLNNAGIPTFKESAQSYGLADDGFSTQGYFFDYDRDGDLDMYLVTNALYDPKTPIRFRPKLKDGSALNTDRLYRNNGNATFTNVSKEAGVTIEGWGHAAAISDFNNDGWPDIYVANDFVSNDLLYINNHDGTFTDKITEYFKHTAWNAMGTNMADVNNDGWADLISLEMLPEDNMRKKRMLSGNEYYNYFNAAQFDYQHQYVRNVLQINSGPTSLGHPVFSDLGFLSGVYQTDWSWCPMVADFDNDGLKDIIITNGLPRDVTDLDYIAYDNGQKGGSANLTLAMANNLPVVNIANYAFKNSNGLQFANKTKDWGLDKPSFCNGAAYTDLDNDGDLDFVINNINETAFIYENKFEKGGFGKANTLSVKLEGSGANRNAIGARIHLYQGKQQQFYEHQPSRGYLSTVDGRVLFGLGSITTIDSLKVIWPDGTQQVIRDLKPRQAIALAQSNAGKHIEPVMSQPLLKNVNLQHRISFKPSERDFIDYTIQSTLPHKLSQYGPGIAVADIDKNGFEDFYLAGTSGTPGVFFMQDKNGIFIIDSTRIPRLAEELQEEMGVLFFDADNDGDQDLYTVTGSYEIPPNHEIAQDRLFINNGKGQFKLAADALPKELVNGSCVRAADFDKDGDLDLFVGGRVVSGSYPVNPQNFILRNTSGKFTDVTAQVCPELIDLGMITDALWSDFDNDGRPDLVLAGEWMPVTVIKNNGKTLSPVRSDVLEKHLGWWNSLAAGDFDNDGDIDYLAGNLGLNSNYTASDKEPMTLYAKDLDNNGSLDAMVFCFMKGEDGVRRAFPMHTKDDLTGQLVSIRKRYPTHKSYGTVTIDDLWPAKDKEGAIKKTVNDLQSVYIENKGQGNFKLIPLPLEAQAAPIYGMLVEDVDRNGTLDVLMVGNDYGMEPYSGRHDALNGLIMKGDGAGNFAPLPVYESGFFVAGDAKGLARIHTVNNEERWIATQNQDSLLMFAKNTKGFAGTGKWINVLPDDSYAEVVLKNGRKRRVEFYYGSTFLSQSSRKMFIGGDAVSVTITNFKGIKRKVQ